MEIAEQKRLKRLRWWAAKFGLSVEILRTPKHERLGFYLRDERSRAVVSGERGLTLDEIENNLLKIEKKHLKELRGER
jgi:hypothetical protein